MSGIPQVRQVLISTLSPVHIGTGEDYTPTDYVIEEDALFEFGPEALARLPKSARDQLLQIVEQKASLEMLKRVQQFFYDRRELLIPQAINVVKVASGVSELYQSRVGREVQEGKINQLQIERAFYHPPTRRLLFPGSSLKGAIRTALLDREFKKLPIEKRRQWEDRIRQALRKQKPDRELSRFAQKLQEELFGYSMRGGGLCRDPLRLFHTSDCAFAGPDSLNSAEVFFAVNLKKKPVQKNGQEIIRGRGPYQILECIPPLRLRAFRGTFAIADVSAADDHQDLPSLRFSFEEIAQACNEFYLPLWEEEKRLLKERGFVRETWLEQTEKLLGSLKPRMERGDALLLRVGRHSGAEAVTVAGVRSIKINRGPKKTPAYESSPTTLWLAASQQKAERDLLPFGWIVVEWFELDQEPPAWEEAEAIGRQQVESMKAWLAELEGKRRAYRRRLKETLAEEKKREEEAARRRQEEEERKRREEALKQLPPEARRLKALEMLFEQEKAAGRKEPQGRLANETANLLREAKAWSAEFRLQAADLAEKIYRYLDMLSGRKGRERKAKIAELREIS